MTNQTPNTNDPRKTLLPGRPSVIAVCRLAFIWLLVIGHCSFAAEGGATPAEIRKIPITIFPHSVLVVRGEMVELDKLKEHLAALVPDAKKTAVEVTVYPNSKAEEALVSEVVRIAKEAGYTNVSYASAKETKPPVTEITILLSQTGAILVNDEGVAEKDLRARLEKLVEPERRDKVRIYVRATRLVKMKRVGDITRLCRDAGFKDVVFGIIAE
jgi:biopolymer transport protein ExbD